MAKFTCTFSSESIHRPITIDVILPTDKAVMPNYPMPEKNRPYRTLYWLEGVLGCSAGPVNYSRILPLCEDYNLAVVIVGGDNQWWTSNAGTGEKFNEMVTRDLINFTRRCFNLSRKREDTFIGGFSMGGYGSTLLGLQHPELFSHVIALDAAYNKGAIIGSSNEETWDLYLKKNYEAMFSLKDAKDYENTIDDYEYLAKKVSEETPELMPKFFLACGDEDALWTADVEFKDYITGLGYDVTWFPFKGRHNYLSVDIGLEEAVSKWLPTTEDNFRENVQYFGPEAGTQTMGGWWSKANYWYNIEMEDK